MHKNKKGLFKNIVLDNYEHIYSMLRDINNIIYTAIMLPVIQ